MQHVSGHVEGQRLLERRNPCEIPFAPRLLQHLCGLVRALHVSLVMLVVMKRHDPAGDVRLERRRGIRKLGKRVFHIHVGQADSCKTGPDGCAHGGV